MEGWHFKRRGAKRLGGAWTRGNMTEGCGALVGSPPRGPWCKSHHMQRIAQSSGPKSEALASRPIPTG